MHTIMKAGSKWLLQCCLCAFVRSEALMPARIRYSSRRKIICDLILRTFEQVSTCFLKDPLFGSRSDDVLLCAAILIGQADRRPMTAAKLADACGIPRPTVVRKLRELEEAGVVIMQDSQATLALDRVNDPEMIAAVEAITAGIIRAAAELSKMDSKAIAREEIDK